jgi:hypothetical protein
VASGKEASSHGAFPTLTYDLDSGLLCMAHGGFMHSLGLGKQAGFHFCVSVLSMFGLCGPKGDRISFPGSPVDKAAGNDLPFSKNGESFHLHFAT